ISSSEGTPVEVISCPLYEDKRVPGGNFDELIVPLTLCDAFFLKELGLSWIANDDELDKLNDGGVGYDDNERSNEGEEKMTIAWRYKKLKKFESGINSNVKKEKPFCQSFDLTKSIPQSAIDSASMTLIDSCTWDNEYKNPFNKLLSMIRKVVDKNFRSVVSTQGIEQRNILRIGIHSIASPSWQSNSPQ
ncbi:3278_t:CDS:2, partial [Dentiscutata erythropus]